MTYIVNVLGTIKFKIIATGTEKNNQKQKILFIYNLKRKNIYIFMNIPKYFNINAYLQIGLMYCIYLIVDHSDSSTALNLGCRITDVVSIGECILI
ncbi:hypothetical protein BpHYR1_025431 [Brachionus plicatilis]|uniref:Uncharacterized protein n=1 Tax=Brachionus plicatilis TaxID=10195 RepID=A0A3M7RBI1_BRAPC|nr:hypothetical protein BpHYR1_025431 [Brachionus plicatilis]